MYVVCVCDLCDHTQQLAAMGAQERHTAQRLAYERLLADKAADDIKLSKLEEQKVLLL
jgi:hypothetical protein